MVPHSLALTSWPHLSEASGARSFVETVDRPRASCRWFSRLPTCLEPPKMACTCYETIKLKKEKKRCAPIWTQSFESIHNSMLARSILPAALVLAALALPAPRLADAQGAWATVFSATFDKYNVGMFYMQAMTDGWHTHRYFSYAEVAIDPLNATRKCLRFTSNQNNGDIWTRVISASELYASVPGTQLEVSVEYLGVTGGQQQ
jgi:hypothetical protein